MPNPYVEFTVTVEPPTPAELGAEMHRAIERALGRKGASMFEGMSFEDEDQEPTLVSSRKDDFRDLVACASEGHVFPSADEAGLAQRDPALGALYTKLLAAKDEIVAHCKKMCEAPK